MKTATKSSIENFKNQLLLEKFMQNILNIFQYSLQRKFPAILLIVLPYQFAMKLIKLATNNYL